MGKKEDKFMGTVKVGIKGQIVIPKEVRDMFDIEPGDSLMIMADEKKGIAMHQMSVFNKVADAIFEGKGKDIYPDKDDEELEDFAEAIKRNHK